MEWKTDFIRKWIEESTAASDTDNYGYLFWRGEYNSYRADGKYSQISMILPDKNAVISMVAECRNGEELMSALYDLVCASYRLLLHNFEKKKDQKSSNSSSI